MKLLLIWLLLFVTSTFCIVHATVPSKQEALSNAETVFGTAISLKGGLQEKNALLILTEIFKDKILPFHSHEIPDERGYYLACLHKMVQFIAGIHWGSCAAYSFSSDGVIEYIPTYVSGLGIGISGGLSESFDVIKLHGIESIDDIEAYYATLNSGITSVAGLELNWVTVGSNLSGNLFNFDTNFGLKFSVINFKVLKVTSNKRYEVNEIQLSEKAIRKLLD